MNKQLVLFSSFLHTPAKAQLASFKVAYRIAKCKKPHTLAEELVLPAVDLVSTMIGESAAPLSNNTISRRIDKIYLNPHRTFVILLSLDYCHILSLLRIDETWSILIHRVEQFFLCRVVASLSEIG